ncbi:MAG: hypothetical protein AVDCRST_MAG73-3929 [uncultured Thermomicrobiales bacterium]|uniref:N-acetyltransferase domain-containing protein n=1 Tax=uncultured Thermomicrobiales bacterium TaxID=1645740 RepID=A0A6J4UXP6_9BACT|nr:MAG: hypothetical protein AVDCRST_MAG73-3929 [uncultured Thermomicrobiales bacterium]
MIPGELVNLCAVDRPDAAVLHRWLNDPVAMRGWGVPDQTRSLSEVGRRIEGWLAEEGERGRPAALLAEDLDGEPVGLVVLAEEDAAARSVALSLLVGDPARWGQGYGADLLRTALGACFDAWGFHRVWLRAEAGNERAHRLYRSAGFVHEGTLRAASFFDGRFGDVLVFGLLEEEWRGRL